MLLQFLVPYIVLSLASSALNAQARPSFLGPAQAPTRRATVCNGHAELCNRSFGNVTFVGAHDSYAIGVNNLAANQDQPITQQLNDGIRMLQMQAHNETGGIRLCHTSCSLYDGGTLQAYLTTVKQWLDANPTEVLSLLIVNIDDLPASSYDPVFKAVGLDTVSYTPPSLTIPASQWPTLGSLIDSGKRLLTFLDNGADLTSVPYLLDEFTNVWESAFDVTDPTFDCNVNRTKGDTSTQMYLINHFLDTTVFNQPVPDVAHANITNSASGSGSLGAQVATCVTTQGRPPNFMLVDFYEYGGGSVFQVAADINGVTYNPSTPVASPASSASGSASSGKTSVISSSLSSGTRSSARLLDFNQLIAMLVTAASIMIGPLLLG
ncbi:PLC-like phosphodiesterase [Gymnopilus junonius]|uniref:PLC-like phosphodiesterase n=1 Tax=Gymnopilus junonius TaxID=109634 RepID=A0A9P5P283_GYMJU|nr:PLC-like phosphodiesterase [Gymnopilus junonius]